MLSEFCVIAIAGTTIRVHYLLGPRVARCGCTVVRNQVIKKGRRWTQTFSALQRVKCETVGPGDLKPPPVRPSIRGVRRAREGWWKELD